MATIGQQLLVPESSWRRIEINDSKISYSGSTEFINGYVQNRGLPLEIKFTFTGSKIRLISYLYGSEQSMLVSIDGNSFETVILPPGGSAGWLVYEKLNLANKSHTIIIKNDLDKWFNIDAIDIDDTGYLLTQVGQQLLTPDESWKRYDDRDSRLNYIGDWIKYSDTVANYTEGTATYIRSTQGSFRFKFSGTKFRLISDRHTILNHSKNIQVTIDGINAGLFSQFGTQAYKILTYECTDLNDGIHEISMINLDSGNFCIDAIDIDSNGKLLHPFLTERERIEDMQVGDVISCKYVAGTSGTAGIFSDLGINQDTMIPVTGSATPNGGFYFIKTAKGTLISDRVLQHSITWDTLNANGFIEGKITINKIDVDNNFIVTASSGNPSLLFDNVKDTLSGVWSGSSGTQWILIKCPQKYKILSFTIQARSDLITGAPTKFIFSGSNDNATWTNLFNQSTLLTWVNGEKKTFNITTPCEYLYYKLTIIANGGTGSTMNQIAELELFRNADYLIRSMSGGVAYADSIPLIPVMTSATTPSGQVVSTPGASGYDDWKSFNQIYYNADQYWMVNPFVSGNYIGYIFNNDAEIDAFSLKAVSTVAVRMPKDFNLYKTIDGVNWIKVKEYRNVPAWADAASVYFKFDSTIKCRGLKIEVISVQSGTILAIDELQFYRKIDNKSLTDKGVGAWPINNEWDKYINGDDNIWHWKNIYTLCADTPIVAINPNSTRTGRGFTDNSNVYLGKTSNSAATDFGFRPVLQYIEPDGSSKQTTLFY